MMAASLVSKLHHMHAPSHQPELGANQKASQVPPLCGRHGTSIPTAATAPASSLQGGNRPALTMVPENPPLKPPDDASYALGAGVLGTRHTADKWSNPGHHKYLY